MRKFSTLDIALLPTLGALMFVSKLLTEALPNVHFLALFIIVFTVLFRAKALISIYLFVIACALHGILFGTLYAPFQAIAFGMNFKSTVAWIIAGLPWDAVHGISNFCIASLSVPIISVMKKVINH